MSGNMKGGDNHGLVRGDCYIALSFSDLFPSDLFLWNEDNCD